MSVLARKLNNFHSSNHLPTIIHMRLQLKTKNGRKLRIFFMKRIRGAGCVVRVTGPTDRRGEHGSLEGVGGLKTSEAYHSKADALVIS